MIDVEMHDAKRKDGSNDSSSIIVREVGVANASGHVDQLTRHYHVKSISAAAVVIDGAWIAM